MSNEAPGYFRQFAGFGHRKEERCISLDERRSIAYRTTSVISIRTGARQDSVEGGDARSRVLSLDEITTAFGEELARLKTDFGGQYTACSNTMKVTREDLISEVGDTMPAMVRLMGRQEQGWIYIKS